jgi:hypothetical protein
MLSTMTFEFLLRWYANGGAMIAARAVLSGVLIYAFLTGAGLWLSPPEQWDIKKRVFDTLPWLGAIAGGMYAFLYARFASQWSYLSSVYHQIKGVECSGCQDPSAMAEWKAAFIEDCDEVHLARKPTFAAIIATWGRDAGVSAAFQQSVPGRGARLEALVSAADAASGLHVPLVVAASALPAQQRRSQLAASGVVPKPLQFWLSSRSSRRPLLSPKPPLETPTLLGRLWRFANTQFGLWFLSAIVLGHFYANLQARWQSDSQREQRIKDLDAEIASRLEWASPLTWGDREIDPDDGYPLDLVDSVLSPPKPDRVLMPEFQNRSLRSLLYELKRLVPSDEEQARLREALFIVDGFRNVAARQDHEWFVSEVDAIELLRWRVQIAESLTTAGRRAE